MAVGRQGEVRKSKTVDELFSSCLSVPGNRNVDIFSVVDVGGRDKVEMARGGNGCWTGGYNPMYYLSVRRSNEGLGSRFVCETSRDEKKMNYVEIVR